jgi:PKD repeat protein
MRLLSPLDPNGVRSREIGPFDGVCTTPPGAGIGPPTKRRVRGILPCPNRTIREGLSRIRRHRTSVRRLDRGRAAVVGGIGTLVTLLVLVGCVTLPDTTGNGSARSTGPLGAAASRTSDGVVGPTPRATEGVGALPPPANPGASHLTIQNVSWNPTTVDVDQPSTISVQVSGGAEPYAYSYTGLPSGCASADASSIVCTPAQSATFVATVMVTDSHHQSRTGTSSLTVNPSLHVELNSNRTTGPAPLDVAFTSNVTGGTPPLTYLWSFGDGGHASSPDPKHTFVSRGSYPVTLQVSDATNSRASSGSTIQAQGGSGIPTYSLTLYVVPAACGPIGIGVESYRNGSTVGIEAKNFTLDAPPCAGYTFSAWSETGGITVSNSTSASATLSVLGNGTLHVKYELGTPGGGGSGGARTLSLSKAIEEAGGGAVVIVAIGVLLFLGRRPRVGGRSRGPDPGRRFSRDQPGRYLEPPQTGTDLHNGVGVTDSR